MLKSRYKDIYDLVSDIHFLGSGETEADLINYLIVSAKIGLICSGYSYKDFKDGNVVVVSGDYDLAVFDAIEDIAGEKFYSLDIDSLPISDELKTLFCLLATNVTAGSYVIVNNYKELIQSLTGVNVDNKMTKKENVEKLNITSKGYIEFKKSKCLIKEGL